MGSSTQPDPVVRFEGFELNRQTGELRKHGIRLNLQDQPFKVLVALLQRPGEMVTREELRQLIWPEESFGDFDHAINRSIAKLRSVLGDSPEVPHLIETLPRRGYRFIGTIEGQEKQREAAQAATGPPTTFEPLPTQPITAAASAAAGTSPRSSNLWRPTYVLAASLLVVAVVVGVWLVMPAPQPRILRTTKLTNDGKDKCCLLTDGARIYFSAFEHIEQIPVTGGDPILVSIPSLESSGGLIVQDISRDNDQLLVDASVSSAADHTLWRVPLSGSSPRHLADLSIFPGLSYESFAQWSPDGQTLVYSTGHDLVLAHSDGTEPRNLFTTKHIVRTPQWSPDGTRLRFQLDSADSDTLVEIPVAGGEPREVTPHWKEKSFQGLGRWIPDGRYFIFIAGRDRNDIWAIRERQWFRSFQKAAPVRLTSGPILYDSLAFSPDGKRIFTIGVELRGEVLRYDPKISQFVPFSPALSADCCVYSNDGQWMAYVTFPEGDLWRSRADGTQRQQLTWPPLQALNPHWSPDGKEIAFSGRLPGKPRKSFIIPAEGGAPQQITQNDCDELEANWSPDGTVLTFGKFFLESTPTCALVIYTMDLKTRQTSIIPGSNDLAYPRWSPKGKLIVAQDKTVRSLMIYDLGSQQWSKLLEAPQGETVEFPQWSRDGNWIYYRIWAKGPDDGAYRIRIADRKVEKIADMSAIPKTGVNGLWAAFDPAGNPIILRDVSLHEIYALDVDLP